MTWVLSILGAMLLPFLIMWLYLVVFVGIGTSERADLAAMLVAYSAGISSIAFGPANRAAKWIVGTVYSLILIPLLFLFGLMYVCAAYGRCL